MAQAPFKLPSPDTTLSTSSTMSNPDTSTHSLFYDLAGEQILNVAHRLSDQDLANFCLSCSKVNNHVAATGYSFFRQRFLGEFDFPNFHRASTGQQMIDNLRFYREYKVRKQVLNVIDVVFQAHGEKSKLRFNRGRTKPEVLALNVLRDLIIDAFGVEKSKASVGSESKNLSQIRAFLDKTNLMSAIGLDSNADPTAFATIPERKLNLLYTIQCALAPALFALKKPWSQSHHSFPDAQMMAYADNITAPVLYGANGVEVNMQWVLGNLQFWHQHLNRHHEALAEAFETLEDSDRPAFASEQLTETCGPLGRNWKGSYAFLDRGAEINDVRVGKSWDTPIIDKLNGEGDPDHPFQNLILQFPEDGDAGPWPRPFEKILSSLKMPVNRSRTRAQMRASGSYTIQNFAEQSTRMQGSGSDSSDDFQADGWLNPLPPQQGIPGWNRMTMMKYFADQNGHIDLDNLWAYEGIVIPGGKIMVGRWWCPSDGEGEDMYSGPFILWNVRDPPKRTGAGDGDGGEKST